MVLSSPGSRYVLKADISRFYPTLYTHSIPWALHTKEVAKAKKKDSSLLGNLIDSATQATQHQQTLGIPVGPDTSDLIAEILGVALDQRMQEVFPDLKGFRYVDNFSLYFTERQQAEAALTALHAATSHFGLEINPNKTDILPMPEAMEPPWKVQLRSLQIRSEDAWEARDLISYFSAAHASAANYPHNQVLKFAVKQTMGTEITRERWPLYESFLLTSLVNEPALAPNLATLLRTYEEKGYIIDRNKLRDSLAEVARYHARLRQGFELAWALWMCKLFTIALPPDVFKEISAVEDSFVALIALDLSLSGLADGLDTSTWRKLMTAQNLYDENWLLAYEAFIKGWLPSLDGTNYVGADDFFETLRSNGVEFYDLSVSEPTSAAYWASVY
jgi:hypothetical protein